MKKNKLKVEISNTDRFFSYTKSGVMKRYLNQEEDILPSFSYSLVTLDKIVDNPRSENYITINEVFIVENKRGKGLGKELMLDIINYFKEKYDNVSILLEANSKWAGSDLIKLKKLYISLGFEELENNFFELYIDKN